MAINLPAFYEDPDYRYSQNYLKDVGTSILSGQSLPGFELIGQTNTPATLDKRNQLISDIQSISEANLSSRGLERSPVGASIATGNIARSLTDFDFNDLLRAASGQQFLLSTGLGTMGDLGSKGLQYGSSKNQFNLNVAQMEAAQKAAEDAQLTNLFSSLGGALGTGLGYAVGGPIGGKVGTKLGSAALDGGANNFSFNDLLLDVNRNAYGSGQYVV